MGAELNKALAAVQKELPDVTKNQTGEVKGVTKEGKSYSYDYKYADLDAVSDAILPVLGKHGLAFTCEPATDDQDRLVLNYALIHEGGEERSSQFPLWMLLPQRFTAQTAGGLITYGRRYCLCAVTGIAPGGDSDAAGAGEVDAPPARGRPQHTRPPSRPTATPVHTQTTGADHERLRHGTVEATPDDRRADRGPLPDSENFWATAPPEEQPGSADPKDVQKIQMAYAELKFSHRTDRAQLLNISEQIVGHPLTGPNPGRTHNNLSHVDAVKLRDTLQALKGDRGALMERLTGITQAVAATAAQDAAEDGQDAPEVTT